MVHRVRGLMAPAPAALAFFLAAIAALGAVDPAREKQLRDALSACDGDWSGEVIIWDTEGVVMETVAARRHHQWVGDVQIAVTAFELGSETISVRMRRWVEDGTLRAIVYWPVSPPESYRGQIGGDGVAWFDEATGHRTLADRFIHEDGIRKLEATSVKTMLLTPNSEQVTIDAVFARMRSVSLRSEQESAPEVALTGSSGAAEGAGLQPVDDALLPDIAKPPVQSVGASGGGGSPGHVPPANGVEDSRPEEISASVSAGSIYVSSDPPYASFVIRRADQEVPDGLFEARTGTTPLLVEGLPAGKYTATFQRSGWPEQSFDLEVAGGQATSLFHRFVSGSVEILSEPSGARILADGRLVGLTPFSQRNRPPGEVSYQVVRPGFHSVEIRGKVQPNRVLVLRADMEPDGSVVDLRDLDERPVPTRQVSPKVRPNTVAAGSTAVIELMVDRRGRVRDVRLVRATDELFGRLCVRAAARWRFNPGFVGDIAVSTRVQIPFVAK